MYDWSHLEDEKFRSYSVQSKGYRHLESLSGPDHGKIPYDIVERGQDQKNPTHYVHRGSFGEFMVMVIKNITSERPSSSFHFSKIKSAPIMLVKFKITIQRFVIRSLQEFENVLIDHGL
jgi:hypothetical protein